MSHRSTTKVDQKEYLKKYLSGDKLKKKKKKKDKSHDADGKVRIIDDDATAFKTEGCSDDELFLTGEDAPQIVGEYVETEPNKNGGNKWRSIATIKEEEQIKHEKSPDDRWGKRAERTNIKEEFSPRERRRYKSPDRSPPRKREKPMNPFKANQKPDLSPVRARNRRETPDQSPARLNPFKKNAHGRSSSADLSPVRNRTRTISNERNRRGDSDDLSPPRLNPFKNTANIRNADRDLSPVRRRNNGSSPRGHMSPPRQRPMRNSNDLSPPRRRNNSRSPLRRQYTRDQSFSGRQQNPFTNRQFRRDNSAELSPRRRQYQNSMSRDRQQAQNYGRQQQQADNRRQNGANNDRYRSISSGSSSQRRRENSRQRNRSKSPGFERQQHNFSAARNNTQNRFGNQHRSPDRRQNQRSPDRRQNQRSPPRRHDTDQSPPRRVPQHTERERYRRPESPYNQRMQPAEKTKIHWETASAVAERKARRSRSASPPPTHKPKITKTLDGKRAGLQDAQALKEELTARRREEDRMFDKMSNELSGRHAEVAVRSTGRRGRGDRDLRPEDLEKQRLKEEREQLRKEKYDRWGKGLKQIEDHRAKLEEQAYESSKPLARYSNDEDLERHLREKERVDDPMLAYMRRKKKEKEKDSKVPQKPVYEGSYPENRFGIRPGYRWDGVDRSNGYEKKWFEVQNAKRAKQEEAYKYSVEDM